MLRRHKLLLYSICTGFAGSVMWFLVSAHIGLDFSDEGYLWYGSQRVMHGEMPIRDFLAYDPGRYFYTATFFWMFRDTGLMTARIAGYSVTGLVIASLVYITLDSGERRNEHRLPSLVTGLVVALLALVWIFPYYKVFEHAASILLVLALYKLFSAQNRFAWGVLGACVGAMAIIGKNHGIYGAAASVLAFLILTLKPRRSSPDLKDAGAWCLGIVIGYLPMIIAFLTVDGFAQAFIAGVEELLRLGKSNIPLPVPWPWTVDYKRWGILLSAPLAAIGLGFVVLLILPALGAAYLFRKRSVEPADAAFVATVCAAVPYAQYAFSRADLEHLTPAMLLMMLAVMTAPVFARPAARVTAMVALVVYSGVVFFDTPPMNYWLARGNHWVLTPIRSEEILVPDYQAAVLLHRRALVESHPGNLNSFLALPNMPTLHAIYETQMATHDIYVLSAVLESHEEAEIARLTNASPRLILISNFPLDHKDEWRFSNLRPRMYQWINRNYRRSVSTTAAGRDAMEVYVRD